MNPADAARVLYDAARRGEHFPEALRGRLSLEEGYRVQREVLALHLAAGARQAGWKIGFTADAVRAMFGADAPVWGYLLEHTRCPGGHEFAHGELIRPALESELCFTLGAPLHGPAATAEQAREAVAAVAPALEIIELRGDMAADLGLGVADNVIQRAWVVGEAVRPFPRDLELGAVQATLVRNGEVYQEALGREVVDDQLASLAWLANQLARFDAALEAGQQVMTGSFNKPVPIEAGDRWEARFSHGLGAVSARFA